MKKLLCILLACLMLTPALVSCSENKAEADDGSSPAGSGGTTQTDTPGVEPEETEEEKITAVSTLTPEDFGGRDACAEVQRSGLRVYRRYAHRVRR